MEEILTKLSEIEVNARRIREEAARTKKTLSEEMEQKCGAFDAELEKETNARIQQLRADLEKSKDSEITALRKNTEKALNTLDAFFEKNRARLCEELFHKILER